MEDAKWFAWLSSSKESNRIGHQELNAALEKERPDARNPDGDACYEQEAIVAALRALGVEVSDKS